MNKLNFSLSTLIVLIFIFLSGFGTVYSLIIEQTELLNWSIDGEIPSGISDQGLELIPDGLFYFGGGEGGHHPQFKKANLYQVGGVTNVKADMPAARSMMASALHNGKVYSIGGYLEGTGQWGRNKDVYCYDPPSDSWSIVAPLLFQRDAAGGASLGDYI